MSTKIRGSQIKDAQIQLRHINNTQSGQCLVTKIVAGENVVLENTGLDDGTGIVTIHVTTTGTGTSGTSGRSGTAGTSGRAGTSGSSGSAGTSGFSGTSGSSGLSGSSGTSGTTGTSGTSGASGTSGTSGRDGTSGSAGRDGSSGSSGVSSSIKRTYCWVIKDPTVGWVGGPKLFEDHVVKKVSSYVTSATTVAFNIEERGNVELPGNNVLQFDQVADVNGAEETTFINDGLASNSWLGIDISEVVDSPEQLIITLNCEISNG